MSSSFKMLKKGDFEILIGNFVLHDSQSPGGGNERIL